MRDFQYPKAELTWDPRETYFRALLLIPDGRRLLTLATVSKIRKEMDKQGIEYETYHQTRT